MRLHFNLSSLQASLVMAAIVAGIMALLAGVFRGPLLSAAENNVAARELGLLALAGKGEQGPNLTSRLAPSFPGVTSSGPRPRLVELLEAAVQRDPGNVGAWRNLASVYRARGDHEAAAEALHHALSRESGNPLATYELARAYGLLGQTDRSLPLYRILARQFPNSRMLVDDEANEYVFQQVNTGARLLSSGQPIEAVAELRRALEVRPSDLFAKAYLAQAFAEAGREAEAAAAIKELHSFSLGTDPRIYQRYMQDILPYLVQQGRLESGELKRIASFLLWQGIVEPVEPVLEVIERQQPMDKATWLLRERLHRQVGDKAAALADIERLVTVDPRDADSLVRLGQALEEDQSGKALDAYRQALAIAPDHPQASDAASKLLQGRGSIAEAEELKRKAAALADNTGWIASRLGVASNDIRLEPEPLRNADFELGRPYPTSWVWTPLVGGVNFGDAYYLGGVDEQERLLGRRALRITGLSAERRPKSNSFWLDGTPGRELARAGFRGPWAVFDGSSLYALTFSYKTANWEFGNTRIMFMLDLSGGPEERLPDTGGRWQRRTFLVMNRRPGKVEARPFFTNWGVGDAWFADIKIDKVIVRPEAISRQADLAEIK